jgi:hypothetical protein
MLNDTLIRSLKPFAYSNNADKNNIVLHTVKKPAACLPQLIAH